MKSRYPWFWTRNRTETFEKDAENGKTAPIDFSKGVFRVANGAAV